MQAPHLLDASMFWVATGGVHRVLATKHQRLAEQGWRHTLLAPGARGAGHVDCGGLRVPFTGGYRLVLNRGHVQRLIEQAQPDIVEAADPYVPAWAVLAATERLGVPAVAFCHSHLPAVAARLAGGDGGMATRRGRWAAERARAYLAGLYARFDLVMAPSQGLARQLREWGVTRAVHQPLGVDCSVFNPAANDPAWRYGLCRQLGLDLRTRILVYSGRFAPEKNLQLLADAVARLGPGHVLVAVGAGPCPPRGPRVFRLPPLHDSAQLARVLASCDAYVHAGELETFGLGVLEAMACGTPVVVSAAGGLGELALHAGLRVQGRRTADWAEAMHGSLRGGATRLTFMALEKAREHDWSWIIESLSRRYLRLLSGRPRAAAAPPLADAAPLVP